MKEKEKENMDNLAYKLKKYTYEDLLELDDEKRYEIINGELYLMSSPKVMHQMVVGEIYRQLAIYLNGKKCTTLVSPIDVCLSNDWKPKKIYNCVQPDVVVVCDKDKITENCIKGAPDLVIEVLSKSTKRHDTFLKFNLYQRYGVKEYWTIDTEIGVISQYILNENNIYTLPKTYDITENIKVNILKDCTISLKELMEKEQKYIEK